MDRLTWKVKVWRAPVLNATAAALLGLLRDGPLSGYQLSAAADAFLGDFWTVTRSQVYRELAAMARTGLVAAQPSGARDKQPYAISPAGREAFRNWLHEEPGPDVVRIPLLLRLAFGDALDPDHRAELLASQRAGHAARLASYMLEEPKLGPGPQRETLRFGIRYERAVLAWFDEDLRAR